MTSGGGSPWGERPSQRVWGGHRHRSFPELFGIGPGEGESGGGLSPVLPPHSPFPRASPAGLLCPRAPSAEPGPCSWGSRWGLGEGCTAVTPVASQGRDSSAGLGSTPGTVAGVQAAFPPSGTDPCLPQPRGSEQGRGSRAAPGCWLGVRGCTHAVGSELGAREGSVTSVCPRQRALPM